VFHSDSFDRADSSLLGSDWFEAAGNWSISSNQLTVATGSPPSIVVSAAAPATQEYEATWFFAAPASGTKIRVIYAYTNTSNYYFAELLFSTSGYVKLYHRSGGSDSELATTGTIDTSLASSLSLCYNGEFLGAHANAGSGEGSPISNSYVAASITAPSGTELFGAGVNTATSAGDVLFGGMQLKTIGSTCAKCIPGNCCDEIIGGVACIFDEDGMPIEVRVVIAGTGAGTCNWCTGDPAVGDWITTSAIYNDPCDNYLSVPCYYNYSELIPKADSCGATSYHCRYELNAYFEWVVVGTSYKIVVRQTYYTASPGSGHDCDSHPCGDGGTTLAFAIYESATLTWPVGGVHATDISGESLTFTTGSGSGCNFSGTTCTVTVLS
jgi:hypothetical protein